jgi:hypothetical protein
MSKAETPPHVKFFRQMALADKALSDAQQEVGRAFGIDGVSQATNAKVSSIWNDLERLRQQLKRIR